LDAGGASADSALKVPNEGIGCAEFDENDNVCEKEGWTDEGAKHAIPFELFEGVG
jgi:hypothetical protein